MRPIYAQFFYHCDNQSKQFLQIFKEKVHFYVYQMSLRSNNISCGERNYTNHEKYTNHKDAPV